LSEVSVGLHDPPMTRAAPTVRSGAVDRLGREVGRGLVVLLEHVGVEAQGDDHRGVPEPLGDHLGGHAGPLGVKALTDLAGEHEPAVGLCACPGELLLDLAGPPPFAGPRRCEGREPANAARRPSCRRRGMVWTWPLPSMTARWEFAGCCRVHPHGGILAGAGGATRGWLASLALHEASTLPPLDSPEVPP
jgi:hypothetical protein